MCKNKHIQKPNELVFLENYLKFLFPNHKYQIKYASMRHDLSPANEVYFYVKNSVYTFQLNGEVAMVAYKVTFSNTLTVEDYDKLNV